MNHYERLGVSQTATYGEIRAAYRVLARRFHPDQQVGAGQVADSNAMHLLNAAWRDLSDATRRADYDRTLRPPRGPNPAGPNPSGEATRGASPDSPIDDDDFFDRDVDPVIVRRWYLLIVVTSIGAVLFISAMMIYAFMTSGE